VKRMTCRMPASAIPTITMNMTSSTMVRPAWRERGLMPGLMRGLTRGLIHIAGLRIDGDDGADVATLDRDLAVEIAGHRGATEAVESEAADRCGDARTAHGDAGRTGFAHPVALAAGVAGGGGRTL